MTISLFKDDEVEGTGTLDPFRLTKDEADIAEALSKRIACLLYTSFVDIYRVFISLTLSYGVLGVGNFCWSAFGLG